MNLGIIGGFLIELQKRKRRRTTAVCPNCETENPKGSSFCRKCGSEKLLNVADFNKVESAGMEIRRAQSGEELQRNRAIRRIKELKTLPACRECNLTFPTASSFCNSCGKGLNSMPDEMAYEIVQEEYPRIIGGFAAYEACRDAQPTLGVTIRSLKEVGDQLFRLWRR